MSDAFYANSPERQWQEDDVADSYIEDADDFPSPDDMEWFDAAEAADYLNRHGHTSDQQWARLLAMCDHPAQGDGR